MHTQEKWKKLGWSSYYEFLHPPIDTIKGDLIDYWIKRLKLGEKVNVKHSSTYMGTGMSQVEVNTGTGARHINNVGFGISQILPVIVESVLASKDAFVIVEQPELHLHPRAQAEIADLFISTAKDNGNRYFIETHSEHIFLRLRRRIAESPDGQSRYGQPCAYYIDREDKPESTPYIVNFDKHGNIETDALNFRDFFADDMKEVIALSKIRFEDDSLWA